MVAIEASKTIRTNLLYYPVKESCIQGLGHRVTSSNSLHRRTSCDSHVIHYITLIIQGQCACGEASRDSHVMGYLRASLLEVYWGEAHHVTVMYILSCDSHVMEYISALARGGKHHVTVM